MASIYQEPRNLGFPDAEARPLKKMILGPKAHRAVLRRSLGASLRLQKQWSLGAPSEVERVPHVRRVLVARSEKRKSVKFFDEPDDAGELQLRVLDVAALCEGRDDQQSHPG